ncbi:MAG TPA: hypothetical protein VME43_23300 [Bryobacteraceae bacterium]|nr:hypothetical protein [Bryobacteraceae bacterium]
MVRIGWLAASAGLWLAMAGTAAGQAAVEYGLGAARAATTTAPARGVGKSMSGLAGSLDKALKGERPASEAHSATTSPAGLAAHSAPSGPASATAAKWEDPGGIAEGLSYPELVRRFGPPSMQITDDAGSKLTYTGKSGAYHVDVEDDKVTSVRKPPVHPPADAQAK